MGKTADVIIIGGGIIGCAIAYNLAKTGVNTLVIEREEIGAGASSRNGGGVRQSARDPRELPLAMHAVKHIWPGLSDELGYNVEYCQGGNLRLGKTEADIELLKGMVNDQIKLGLEMEMLDGAAVREVLPYASESIIGASWCPTDGHANPLQATLAYYKKALELGVGFIVGEEVVEIQVRRGKVAGVRTSEGTYESAVVVNAAGVASRKLAQTVGLDFPMQPWLLETLVTDQQPDLFPQMLGTAGSDFYGHQSEHGSFVFGGLTGWEQYEFKDYNTVTKSNTAPCCCRAILNYFPWMERSNVVRAWSGFIAIVADMIPVMGNVNEIPGLVFASCFCGHGFGISPVVGELIAELIVNGEPTLSLNEFCYDRFVPRN